MCLQSAGQASGLTVPPTRALGWARGFLEFCASCIGALRGSLKLSDCIIQFVEITTSI